MEGTGAHVVKPWGWGRGTGPEKLIVTALTRENPHPEGLRPDDGNEFLSRSLARSLVCARGRRFAGSPTARYSKANGAKVMKRNPVVSVSYGRAFETYL